MLTPFLALVRKDLKLFLTDRRAVVMSVVAPIAIASFFGYIFGGQGSNQENSRLAILISDQDQSAFSREIVSKLQADASLDAKLMTPEAARETVRKGKASAAVLIPKNFAADTGRAFLVGGTKPEIAMLFDPSRGLEMRMVQGVLTGAVMESAGKQMRGNAASQPTALVLPFRLGTEAVTAVKGIPYNGYAHSFGGMGVQFLLMVGVDVGIALLLLRRQGVWKRMRAAPLSRTVLLGSRTTSSALISMGTLFVLFTFARVVFGVKIQGSMAGFVGICIAFSLMTAAFGLLIATLGKTPEATRGVAILTTLIMVMLGGAWVPSFVFPKWLQAITVVIPTRWAVDGLDAVTWRGQGFASVAQPIALLFGCALVFGAIAVFRFRWEAD